MLMLSINALFIELTSDTAWDNILQSHKCIDISRIETSSSAFWQVIPQQSSTFQWPLNLYLNEQFWNDSDIHTQMYPYQPANKDEKWVLLTNHPSFGFPSWNVSISVNYQSNDDLDMTVHTYQSTNYYKNIQQQSHIYLGIIFNEEPYECNIYKIIVSKETGQTPSQFLKNG